MSLLPHLRLSCHAVISLATLSSLLPCFPHSHLSCHICDIVISLATFVKIVVAVVTLWKLGFPPPMVTYYFDQVSFDLVNDRRNCDVIKSINMFHFMNVVTSFL
jgi:hypothetical protein